MSRRVIVEDRHTGEGWIAFMLIAAVVIYGKELLLFALVLGGLYMFLKWAGHREQLKAIKMVEEAHVPKSEYYPYETMPLTYPIGNTFRYNDFDDGLRDWK